MKIAAKILELRAADVKYKCKFILSSTKKNIYKTKSLINKYLPQEYFVCYCCDLIKSQRPFLQDKNFYHKLFIILLLFFIFVKQKFVKTSKAQVQ